MQFATVDIDGACHFGALTDDGFIDLTLHLPSWRNLKSAIEAQGLDELAKAAMKSRTTHRAGSFRHRLPVGHPERILVVRLSGGDNAQPGSNVPQIQIAIRFASSLVGHGRSIWVPHGHTSLVCSAGIAAIMGRKGRRIARQDALDHIAALSLCADGTCDGMQHGIQGMDGACDRTGALGPGIFMFEDAVQLSDLDLTFSINGREMQRDTQAPLSDRLAEVIELVSTMTELQPGDVVAVLPKADPTIRIGPQDEVLVTARGLGQLRNRVVLEEAR